MDYRILANLAKNSPELVNVEVMNEMLVFLFVYLKKVIFLPGMVEQWVVICDIANMSLSALPRSQI